MKIAIVGAGAMGSLFGGLLAEAGQDVWLLDLWPEHVQAIRRDGLRIETPAGQRKVEVRATMTPEDVDGFCHLVIVFVKSIHTAAAAETAAALAGPEGRVLTLQNGMGNAEVIGRFVDHDRIVVGTTAHGATMLGPGHIRHAGSGLTVIGSWKGRNDTGIEEIAAVFNEAEIVTRIREDILEVIWEKLLVNVGINAITALCGIKNGQLLDLPVTRQLCASAVEEAAAVARALGVNVRQDIVTHVLEIARATAANRSSMGQDVDARRPTEITAINGAVVDLARKVNLPVPVNQTLTALVETLQAHF